MKKGRSKADRLAIVELYLVLAGAVVVFVISGKFDLLESLVSFSHQHENLELDELIITCFYLVIALAFYSYRRWRVSIRTSKELQKRTIELSNVTKEVEYLKGHIPICPSCKKIQDEKGRWQPVESYLRTHSDANFSHGVCPECIIKLYGKVSQLDP